MKPHPRSVVLAAHILRRRGHSYGGIVRAFARAGRKVSKSVIRDWTKYRTRVVS